MQARYLDDERGKAPEARSEVGRGWQFLRAIRAEPLVTSDSLCPPSRGILRALESRLVYRAEARPKGERRMVDQTGIEPVTS